MEMFDDMTSGQMEGQPRPNRDRRWRLLILASRPRRRLTRDVMGGPGGSREANTRRLAVTSQLGPLRLAVAQTVLKPGLRTL